MLARARLCAQLVSMKSENNKMNDDQVACFIDIFILGNAEQDFVCVEAKGDL